MNQLYLELVGHSDLIYWMLMSYIHPAAQEALGMPVYNIYCS